MEQDIQKALGDARIFSTPFSVSRLDRGSESKNYLISKDNKKYVLKVYSGSDTEEIRYEIEILNRLKAVTRGERYFPTLKKGIFYVNRRPAILLDYIYGKVLKPGDLSEDTIKKIAATQAKMHSALVNYEPVHKKFRFPILDFDFAKLFLNSCESPYNIIVQKEIRALKKESLPLKKLSLEKTIIHEDLTAENIIMNDLGEVKFIDFGESHKAEAISDIATAIKELVVGDNGVNFDFIKQYLDSYRGVRPVTREELDLLPFLLRRRTVFMMAYWLCKQSVVGGAEFDERVGREAKNLGALWRSKFEIGKFIERYQHE